MIKNEHRAATQIRTAAKRLQQAATDLYDLEIYLSEKDRGLPQEQCHPTDAINASVLRIKAEANTLGDIASLVDDMK